MIPPEEIPVATLMVWRFDTADGADRASQMLQELAREEIVVIHDAATVAWESGKKKPKTRRALQYLAGAGALGGAWWGLLFGLIFFVPLLGAAIGAATGALSGSLADVGIDDTFINRTRDQITPGTSALFVMTSDAVMDKVKDAFASAHRPSELLFTNLTGGSRRTHCGRCSPRVEQGRLGGMCSGLGVFSHPPRVRADLTRPLTSHQTPQDTRKRRCTPARGPESERNRG